MSDKPLPPPESAEQATAPPMEAPAPPPARPRGIVFMHHAEAPTFVPFPPGRLVLGRDPAAGIPLAGRAVSWQHAELVITDDQIVIRDLDSTNGVQVGGLRVREARLDGGALVRLGDFLGLVVDEPFEKPAHDPFPEAEKLGFVIGPALAAALAPLAALGPRPKSARSRATRITVEGETGAGKAMVARLIHERVAPQGTFRAVDCATWGAEADTDGAIEALFEECQKGSVFLGNLPALSPRAQVRLAAALEDGGAAKVTLIVGSQEPLEAAVKNGELLPSLVPVVSALTVRVPPLRQRVIDIPVLFRHLVQAQGRKRRPTISTELLERLCLYDWPCNVREMVLLAQRLLAFHGDEPRLRVTHLPARLVPVDREDTTLPVAPVVSGVDLSALLNAVRDAGGNIGGAALRLGITRERAYRLIDRMGLTRGSA